MGSSALRKSFQGPIDRLGVAKMIALGQAATDLAASAGFVFAMNANGDELDV
jgi:hypothetical protein